jgi:hypothetical protein
MNRILEAVEWVRGAMAETTARRHSFRTIEDALAFGSNQADAGRKVAYSCENLAVAISGPRQADVMGILARRPVAERVSFFVVTVRPTPIWEESEDRQAARARTQADAEEARELEFYRQQGL